MTSIEICIETRCPRVFGDRFAAELEAGQRENTQETLRTKRAYLPHSWLWRCGACAEALRSRNLC